MQNTFAKKEVLLTTFMDVEKREYTTQEARKITNSAIKELFSEIFENVVSSFKKD